MLGDMEVWFNYLSEEKIIFSARARLSLSRALLGFALAAVGILAVIIYNPHLAHLLFGYVLSYILAFSGLIIAAYNSAYMLQSRKKAKSIDLLISMISDKQLTTEDQVSAIYNARVSNI